MNQVGRNLGNAREQSVKLENEGLGRAPKYADRVEQISEEALSCGLPGWIDRS